MTFTRYKLLIGGEKDFSFHPMRIFQFFTNLKEEDFFFIQNLAWFTNHSKHFDSGIHVGSYKTIAFRNPFTKWDLVYLPKLTNLLREARRRLFIYFFKTLKLVPNSLGFVHTCCRWQSVQYLAHASNYGGQRNLLSCLPPHKSEFAFVLVKQRARTTDDR